MDVAIPTQPETLSALLALPPLPKNIKDVISPVLSTSHLSLLAASQMTSLGFSIASRATSLGFGVARTFAAPVLAGVGTIADYALGSNGQGFGDGVVSKGLNGALDAAEFISLLAIRGGKEITQATLGSLTSTVALLEHSYGNDEALRALAAFLKLVDFEMSELRQYTSLQTTRAMATWMMLQGVTSEYYGRKIAGELEEVDLRNWKTGGDAESNDVAVIWEITEEQVAEGGEEVIEASVSGEQDSRGTTEDRDCLRRYSKLCLGSYGGMGMIFFGVKLPSFDSSSTRTPSTLSQLTPDALTKLERQLDEESLAKAFQNHSTEDDKEETAQSDIVEAELGSLETGWLDAESEMMTPLIETVVEEKPGFWGLLSGKHDLNLIETLGGVASGSAKIGKHHDDDSEDEDDRGEGVPPVAKDRQQRPKGRHPPRFFVITDHTTRRVMLCLRGTLSLDDVATDLACEPAVFDSSLFWDQSVESPPSAKYQVHGGMFEIALAIGGPSSTLTRAISKALRSHPDYDLHLVGHSLGAGVAALLGIVWANPETSTTATRSGLPAGRRLKVYGFAPPATMDRHLGKLASKICHSFVYSTDAVPRFSLGHIRDIRSAVLSLCRANDDPEESCNRILTRVLAYRAGRWDGDAAAKLGELQWFEALRSSLDADMQSADLFPPGEVFWLTEAGDIVLPDEVKTDSPRLFKITGRVDVVFQQMLFTKSMLSSHLPHSYMNAVHNYL